jgi:predicted dehydrogenase
MGETMYTAVVIGCGRIGSLYDTGQPSDPLTHAGAYAAHDRVKLIAGVDPDEGRRKDFAARWGVPAYAALEEMLSQFSPDLWSICTEASSHFGLVKKAINAGARGIWCEKPLASSLEEAVGIQTACAQARVPLLINHSRRFDKCHQDLARRLRAGEWGHVERVVIHYVRGISNYGSHAFDLLRFLLTDDIDWISAWDDLRELVPDPSLTVRGRTCQGVFFSLLPINRSLYDCLEVDVRASCGRLTVTHLGKGIRQYRVGPSPYWDEPTELLEAPGQFLPGMQGLALQALSNLIAHMETGAPLLSSCQDGVAAVAAVSAARCSTERHGEPVEIRKLLSEIGAAV